MKKHNNKYFKTVIALTLLSFAVISTIIPLNISAFSESGKLYPGQVVSGKYGNYSASYTTISNISKTTGTAYTHGCITVFIEGLTGGVVKKSTCYSNPKKTVWVSWIGRAKHNYYGGLGQ